MEEKYHQDTIAYLNENKRTQIVWELLSYAHMLYKRVYVFKNYEAFSKSFRDNPPEEYWNGLHYESLIDSIKICTAFENYNKAMLLKKGYLVHQINSKKNRALAERQKSDPVPIDEFLLSNEFRKDDQTGCLHLDGLMNFKTISFSLTLKESYQNTIGLDKEFFHFLNGMNSKRNRLHFYKNTYGAFRVETLLQTLSFAKEYGTKQIEVELEALKGVDIY